MIHPVAAIATAFAVSGTSIADSASSDPTSLGSLLQTGGFTALAAILLIFARTAYKRESDRSDRLDAELNKTNELVRDRVMPIIEKASTALEQATLVLMQVQERMRDDEYDRRRDEERRRHAPPP